MLRFILTATACLIFTSPIIPQLTAESTPLETVTLTPQGKFSSFPASLYKAAAAIESLPEAEKLIDAVQKDGPIGIEAQYFRESDFEAIWDSENRIIYVNLSKNETLGKEISSILFELHNARTNQKLLRLFQEARTGLIDIDSFVESVERLEHQNALSTSKMIEEGIARAIFPEEARWDLFTSFDDHYKIQQLYGHSQWIAERFDSLCPCHRRKAYRGTVRGLDRMSPLEKNKIIRLLLLKNQMRSPDPALAHKAYESIQEEFRTSGTSPSDHAKEDIDRSTDKHLFDVVFGHAPTS